MTKELIKNCPKCGKKLHKPILVDTKTRSISCYDCFTESQEEKRYPNQMRYSKNMLEYWK